MVALSLLAVVGLLVPVPAFAAPASKPIVVPHIDPLKILCQLPILSKFLCPPVSAPVNSGITRSTPLGTAQGVQDPDGAYRFSVKYGTAARWATSSVVTSWKLPNGFTNASALPLACPQSNIDSSAMSEDCLSMILYVPPSLTTTSGVPTMVWIHGGSFVVGSASGPGLDGSKLAIATNSIVAVVQYRLGALGLLAPNGQTNLPVKDVVTALNFLKTVLPSFGGTASKVTLAGQSSGANMIRALLAAPSASSLFRSAILQSDPMDFGFLSPKTQQTLVSGFSSQIACSATASCLNAVSLSTILDGQNTIYNTAMNLDPAAGQNQPLRPTLDGSFITAPLDSTGAFPSQSKPLLLTSVANEAGFAIFGNFQDPLPEEAFEPVCSATFGPDRTDVVVNAPFYPPVTAPDGSVDARTQLQTVGTDYLWKCSSWTFARSWIQHGGSAFVGQYVVGASYPGNEVVPYCTQAGVVCHQDDIQIVFGTTSNPTSAQAALTTEMQKRYKAFLSTGNPNTAGVPTWTAATTSNVHPILLGGSGEATVGACDPSFWGSSVQYDYQFFDE